MLKKLCFAATFMVIVSPALAVDFSESVHMLNGQPMKGDHGQPVTLEEVVTNSLLVSYQDEGNLPGEEKVKRFMLAAKIHQHPKDPVLTADEIALIKKLVAKAYNPLVVGEIWRALDPASVK